MEHLRLPAYRPALPLGLWLFLVCLVPSVAAAQSVSLVKQFGAWSLYADAAEPKVLCFVTTQPATIEPTGAKRDAVHLYVTAWPKDGVKSEPSVKLGYRAKKASEITATIGTSAFKLFAKEERAFVSDATEELKLLEAMKKASLKKGSKLVLKATSERGTTTTDTYSLAGLSQALQELATCR